ncbi:MAG: serine/threonine protein phosphatase [Eubacterium sp.]|jgi:UDP-2,3-diacylglucosamine pyrophosphatase LpxH|nr:serine/threonine protein phosphatase [Eubacterium sp.]
MGCRQRLNKSFKNAPVLPLSPANNYVLFSDCHRGNGTHNDNFLRNEHLYIAALRYYYQRGFTYIELGDGDELWENQSMEPIKEIHSDVFGLLSQFYQEKRLYMIYGNHDIVKKYPSFSKRKCGSYFCTTHQCTRPLFPGITFYPAIILRDPGSGKSLYLTHGHQASLMNSTLWPINRFLVRYVWKPLEQVGILDPTSAAKNYTTKERSETRLVSWAKSYNRTLVTGHTHRPMMCTETSPYLNTGSCVHPYCVTCIEVRGCTLTLVKWYMDAHDNGSLYVEREELADDEKGCLSHKSCLRQKNGL